MKQKILFQGIVLLAIVCLVDGFLMADFMSLIVAVFLGFLADLARAGSKPGAPHAKRDEYVFGSDSHQTLYMQALARCLARVTTYRALMMNEPGIGEAYRKYDKAKWTYALLYGRYEEAKKIYGWRSR